jgi:hypothetical protein
VNAQPLLNLVAMSLAKHGLEATMVRGALAARHKGQATPLDVDFIFRKTPTNLRRLRAAARELGAMVFKQYYPRANCFALMNDEAGWRVTLLAEQQIQSSHPPT